MPCHVLARWHVYDKAEFTDFSETVKHNLRKMSKYFSEGVLDRLLEAYNAKNLSQLSKSLQIANSTMDGWIKGNTDFPMWFLMKFKEETRHSVHWLLYGEGEKYASGKDAPEEEIYIIVKKRNNPVPEIQVADQKLIDQVRKAVANMKK